MQNRTGGMETLNSAVLCATEMSYNKINGRDGRADTEVEHNNPALGLRIISCWGLAFK